MNHHVDQFSLGVWVVFLALAVSTIGCAVGLSTLRKWRHASDPLRGAWWLGCTTLGVGIVGIWLTDLINLAGYSVTGTHLRYSGLWVGLSVVVVLAATAVAAIVIGRAPEREQGSVETARVAAGGALLGLGVVGGHRLLLTGMHAQGSVSSSLSQVISAAIIAVLTAGAAVWLTLSSTSRPRRIAGALIAAVGIVGMHYVVMASVAVDVVPGTPVPSGVDIFTLLVPVFAAALLLLTIPITSLLMAPSRVEARLEAEAERWAEEEWNDDQWSAEQDAARVG